MVGTALHVSPHPDDEVLGAGATLIFLRRAGWRVVNLACSLGRPADHERRQAELSASLAVLGLEGMLAVPPVAMSAGDDLAAAERRIAELVSTVEADLVISPHPEDAHHAHAVVGRAVAAAATTATRWWAWGLWRDVAAPNRLIPYDQATMEILLEALRCHAGEVDRNPYDDLLPARARVGAVLGSERVMGFGTSIVGAEPYADLLEERVRDGSGWHLAGGHVVGLGHLVDPNPD
jgi:LmbE family N-acetylglucosaminyl deacetylase